MNVNLYMVPSLHGVKSSSLHQRARARVVQFSTHESPEDWSSTGLLRGHSLTRHDSHLHRRSLPAHWSSCAGVRATRIRGGSSTRPCSWKKPAWNCVYVFFGDLCLWSSSSAAAAAFSPRDFGRRSCAPPREIRWNQTSVGVGVVLLLLLSIHSVCVLEMRIRRRRDETNVPQQNARSLVSRVTRV